MSERERFYAETAYITYENGEPAESEFDGDYVEVIPATEADRLREALRETREALVAELPEGEQSLKWKNVLERSRAIGDTLDE